MQGFKVFTLKTLHFENGRALSVFKIQAAINAQTVVFKQRLFANNLCSVSIN